MKHYLAPYKGCATFLPAKTTTQTQEKFVRSFRLHIKIKSIPCKVSPALSFHVRTPGYSVVFPWHLIPNNSTALILSPPKIFTGFARYFSE